MKNIKQKFKTTALVVFALMIVSCKKDKQLPNVTTGEINGITIMSAIVASSITSDGGAAITARGICWNTLPNVSIENNENKTSEASLSGETKSKIINLKPSTVYYVRAYATNSVGTAYGEEKQFSTNNTPLLNTVTINNLTASTCNATSSVIVLNYLEIQKKGIVLRSASGTNTIIDSLSKENISINLSALLPNTQYFAKSFVTDLSGTYYGEEISFTTKNIPVLSKVTVTNITDISCHFSASITSNNCMPITQKGIMYKPQNMQYIPENSTYNTIIDKSTGENITIDFTNLYSDTQYLIKAFVTNEDGTFYGEESYFFSYVTPFDPNNPRVLKPNIYLYPKTTTQLQVELLFPKGGHVTTSIPEYGTGWNARVEPNGTIDNTYSYLFYESEQANVWQYAAAWCIKKADLKDFFIKNMEEYGFKGQEISDFTDFWIPRLTKYEYYIIYPQDTKTINTAITLQISQTPENLLRLFYVISGSQTVPSTKFEVPVIDHSFSRSGFFVTEWGVILK